MKTDDERAEELYSESAWGLAYRVVDLENTVARVWEWVENANDGIGGDVDDLIRMLGDGTDG